MNLAAGIIAGVITLVLLFRPFFGSFEDFKECIRFWITPDIISLLRGELEEDWLSEMKLWLYFFMGFAVGFLVYVLL